MPHLCDSCLKASRDKFKTPPTCETEQKEVAYSDEYEVDDKTTRDVGVKSCTAYANSGDVFANQPIRL
jgi:hypothetical protein